MNTFAVIFWLLLLECFYIDLHCCYKNFFPPLFIEWVLITQSSFHININIGHKGILPCAAGVWWMMAILRTTCFLIPVTSRSKKNNKTKVWNKSTDLSNWDFVPCTICSRDQKSTSERIKRSICLHCWLVPVVFVWSKLGSWLICTGVSCETFSSQINI